MTDQTNTQSQKQNIVVTRVIEAPVEQVWQAWVEPELVKRWWGPDGFTAPVARMDFREGGVSLVCMSAPQFGFPEQYSTWEYTRIVSQQEIEWIHNLAGPEGNKVDPAAAGMPPDFPEDVRSVVTFKDLGSGKTEMTVTEYGWEEGQMKEMSRQGLEQCMSKLAAIFGS